MFTIAPTSLVCNPSQTHRLQVFRVSRRKWNTKITLWLVFNWTPLHSKYIDHPWRKPPIVSQPCVLKVQTGQTWRSSSASNCLKIILVAMTIIGRLGFARWLANKISKIDVHITVQCSNLKSRQPRLAWYLKAFPEPRTPNLLVASQVYRPLTQVPPHWTDYKDRYSFSQSCGILFHCRSIMSHVNLKSMVYRRNNLYQCVK